MVKTKFLRRHFIEEAVRDFNAAGKILEVGSGENWRFYHNSITLNNDKSAKPDIVGNAEDMQNIFESNSFDSVVCLEVLEHTQNPVRLIEEIYRILKPGGKLLLSVPFVFEIHAIDDYHRFTKKGLVYLLNKFNLVNIQENGGKYCVIFHFLRLSLVGYLLYPLFNNIGYFIDLFINNPNITLGYTLTARK
jgi:SAM-dependent methyltransferase